MPIDASLLLNLQPPAAPKSPLTSASQVFGLQRQQQEIQQADEDAQARQQSQAQDASFMQLMSGQQAPSSEQILSIYGPDRGLKIAEGLQALSELDGKRVTDARETAGRLALGVSALSPELRQQFWPGIRDAAIKGGLGTAEQIPEQMTPEFLQAITNFAGMASQAQDPYTLSPGAQRRGANNELVAENPAQQPAPPPPRDLDPFTVAVHTAEQDLGRKLTLKEVNDILKDTRAQQREPIVAIPDPNDPTKSIYVRESEAVGKNVPATQRSRTVTGRDRDVLGFYRNMELAAENMDTVEGQLTAKDMALIKNLPVPELIGNSSLSQAGQTYAQALQIFTENRLRKKSGAAIANSEYENDKRAYGRSIGDTPKTIAQKKASRQRELDGLAISSGPAYEEHYGEPYPKAGKSSGPNSGYTLMVGPDGVPLNIRNDQIDEAKKRGAKVVGGGG